MIDVVLDEMQDWFGFGVAGNFAGHLEQAGEAADFTSVVAAPEAPKGIFPWYAPGSGGFLETFPLSTDRVDLPGENLNLQIEPEVGLACDVVYEGGAVSALRPFALGAFNDCSIRREGAPKISVKKNWGAASKGVAARFFACDDLDAAGGLRLGCLLRSGDQLHEYGVDSPLSGYSYYGATLLDWIVERLANQRDGGPLEDVGAMLRAARPARVLIGIGATRYTDLGATTFLSAGDEAIVVVYDPERAADAAAALDQAEGVSVLRQSVLVH